MNHPITSRTAGLAVVLLVVLVFAGGCGRRISIPEWQQSIERYVMDQGSGDPTVLRDTTLAGSQRGFGVISHNEPGKSSDARGILLAHQPVAGKPRFIYLVGLVQKQRVRDIRLAALSVEGERFRWRVSREDDQALHRYRQHNQRMWQQRFPGRQRPPVEYIGFPREEDVFDLKISGSTIIARHPASEAQWELSIPQERGGSRAAVDPKKPAARSTAVPSSASRRQ